MENKVISERVLTGSLIQDGIENDATIWPGADTYVVVAGKGSG